MNMRRIIVGIVTGVLLAMTVRASDLTVQGNLNATGAVNAVSGVFSNLSVTGSVAAVSVSLGGDTRTNWPGTGAVDLTEAVIDFSQPAPFYRFTMSSDTTWVFTNHVAGRMVFVQLTQDSTGNHSNAWGAAVLWPATGVPNTTTNAGHADLYQFVDTGTRYLGTAVGLGYAMSGSGGGGNGLTASGFNDANANGALTEAGTHNGRPYYTLPSGWVVATGPAGDTWYIAEDLEHARGGQAHYFSSSTELGDTWEVGFYGSAPTGVVSGSE